MTNILAFFGSKTSGKSSSALFVYGSYMCSLGLVRGGFCIKEDGLWITDLFSDDTFQGRFDPYRNNETMKAFLWENISPYVKLYSFADELKQFCIKVLGLRYEQCYGANADKDSLTELRWENIPGVICNNNEFWTNFESLNDRLRMEGTGQIPFLPEDCGLISKKEGFMTAREVMQYFGTNIVRKMYGPAWAKATLRKIKEDQPLLAIITDGRFEDECDEVRANNGKCVKLLRSPLKDEHESEKIAIPDEKFDAIIDNSNMSLDEQNDELVKVLIPWGVLPEVTFTDFGTGKN